MRALVVSVAVHAIVFAGALSVARDAPPVAAARVIEMRLVEPAPLPEQAKAPEQRKAPEPVAAPRDERRAPPRVPKVRDEGKSPEPAVVARDEGKSPEPAVGAQDEGNAPPGPSTARPGDGDPRRPTLDLSARVLPPSMTGDGPSTARVRGSANRLPAGLQPDGEGTYRYVDTHFTALIDRDGTVHFDHDLPVRLGGGAIVSFDVTEAVMMAVGDDPYRHEKRKFLEETNEFRAALCGADRSERMKTALLKLPKQLEQVWKDARLDAAERRARLFALWDECAEGSEDVEQAKMGAMARAIVLGFIKRHLPAGSPDAYSHEELAALNAKRISKSPFAPY